MKNSTLRQALEGLGTLEKENLFSCQVQHNLTIYCAWQGRLIEINRVIEVEMLDEAIRCKDSKGDIYYMAQDAVAVLRYSGEAEKRAPGFV